MSDSVVIVGAGHAAGQAVATLRQKGFDGAVILLGAEAHYPYQRPPLSKKFLAGEMEVSRLYFKPASFYADKNIELHLNTLVTRIDTGKQLVIDANDNSYQYGSLILATGARVRRLKVRGSDLSGIHYLRNIQDVVEMQESMRDGKRLVIIGGGYIGLEVAAVASGKGLQVTVIEMADRVMSRVVSESVSDFYQNEHRKHDVQLKLSTGLDGFSGDGAVQKVHLSDGTSIDADLVLIGVGVVPNVELAENAGLAVEDGIRVDDHCRTSADSIYAIGDCTNHPNNLLQRRLRLESVHNALEQAKTAASNICGEDVEYSQVPWFWSDQYDLKLQIAGISQGYDSTVLRGDPASRKFSCVYLRDRRMIAIDSINSPKDFMQSKSLIARRALIRPEKLADASVELKIAGASESR